jgi:hypothetical protein
LHITSQKSGEWLAEFPRRKKAMQQRIISASEIPGGSLYAVRKDVVVVQRIHYESSPSGGCMTIMHDEFFIVAVKDGDELPDGFVVESKIVPHPYPG